MDKAVAAVALNMHKALLVKWVYDTYCKCTAQVNNMHFLLTMNTLHRE